MNDTQVILRVGDKIEQLIKTAPITTHVLKIPLESGIVEAAFHVINLEMLDRTIRELLDKEGLPNTLQLQRVVKPLCIALRHKHRRTSEEMEWRFLSRVGEKVLPEKDMLYPVHVLGAKYNWKEMPAKPGAPEGVLVPQFDVDSDVGIINTGEHASF